MRKRRVEREDDEDADAAPIRKYIERVVDEAFLDQYGAHAVGVGRRRAGTDGARYELCLVLYVEPGRKRLAPGNEGDIDKPITWTDPDTGQQVLIPTDVVEATVARMNAGPPVDIVRNPVPGGVSCSVKPTDKRPGNMATLGGWAWDLDDHSIVLLSNLHALGDDPETVICHPAGLFSLGKRPPRLGQVKRGTRSVNGRNEVDCAIGSIDEPERATFEVLNIGPAIMSIRRARRDLKVEKMGVTTQHTRGTIDELVWSGKVKDLAENIHFFSNCFTIEPEGKEVWADDGDSGSLVFDATDPPVDGTGIKPVVGLHFGSKRIGGRSLGIACRIERVFEALHLQTLPSGLFSSVAGDLHETIGTGGLSADHEVHRAVLAADTLPNGAESSSPISGAPDEQRAQVAETMLDFCDLCEESETGRSLLAVVDGHRVELVTLLISDAELRSAAVDVLRPIFSGATDLDGVLDRSVSGATGKAISRFADALRKSDARPALQDAMAVCVRSLPTGPAGERVPLRDVLGVRTPRLESASGGPPRAPRPLA